MKNLIHDLLPLFENPAIEDIHISPRQVSFFKENHWHFFQNLENHSLSDLWIWSRQIAETVDCELGFTCPSVDSVFQFKSQKEVIHKFRAHVVVSPMVSEGPEITLRRLRKAETMSLFDFEIDSSVRNRIQESIQKGHSFLVLGPTGAGKTSFICALLSETKPTERILILEDSFEIEFSNPLSSHLLSRQSRFQNRLGSLWDLQHLVFEALRMRPDRIVLGECRGKEAFAVYQALSTGHKGICTSLHAGRVEDGLDRFAYLAAMGASDQGLRNLKLTTEDVSKLWDVVVVIGKPSDSSPQKRTLKEIKWNNC
jgi:pilus assembly protein CpaF